MLIRAVFVMGQFKIALCQLSITSDKNQNLDRASRSIRLSVEQGAKLLVLPVS